MAIKTRTIHEPDFAGGDARIEDYLTKKGVSWTFHPKVQPGEFDVDKSLQNQARVSKPLDEPRVETYAEAMKRGEDFPPVIAWGKPGKYIIADGNHRLNAAIKAHYPLKMYLIDGDPRTIVSITFEANARHGLPTSHDDKIQHALYLIENGATIPAAAAALALKRTDVEKASLARSTNQRFQQARLPLMTIEKLTEPVRRRLAQISTDEGFVAGVNLAVDAALKSDEVFTLVTDINEVRSSSGQVEYVNNLRRDIYGDRINGSAGGTFTRKSMGPKSRVGIAIAQITGLPDDLETVAASWIGPERAEAAERIKASAKRLNELAKVLAS